MAKNLFYPLALAGVRELAPYQPGKPIEELEREYGVENAIKLASNENPLGASPLVTEAVYRAFKDISRYPDGSGYALKAALSSYLGISADQITLGNGSSDLLEFVARVFVSHEHEVVYSQYCFAMYPVFTKILGAQGQVVPAKNFGHDLEAMSRAINKQTRLVYIANPNNPTGTWLSADELEAFLRRTPKHVLIVLDEAYYEYVGDHINYPNSLAWLKVYPNLIITRTFSKAYGLAGLRVGYGLSHRDLADLMNRVRPPFNVNSLALVAATVALQDQDHVQRSQIINRDGMAQLTSAFTTMNLDYIPSVGNFVAVDVGEGGKVYEALLRRGIIVRPMVSYDLPRHLRVTVGQKDENTRFIRALAAVLEELR